MPEASPAKIEGGRKEIGEELLREVQRCARMYHEADESGRAKAEQLYIDALSRFNDFVLHGAIPPD
jgi:hypothetical protein